MRWRLYDLHVKVCRALTPAVRAQLRRELITAPKIAGVVLVLLLLLTVLYSTLVGVTTSDWSALPAVALASVVATVLTTLLAAGVTVLVTLWLNWPRADDDDEEVASGEE